MEANLPFAPCKDGIELAVRATPRAAKAGIGGLVHDAAGAAWLSVHVSIAPDGGRANAAVLALLAKALDVAPRDCRLLSGASGRWKRVRIQGDPETLAHRAAALAAPSDGH